MFRTAGGRIQMRASRLDAPATPAEAQARLFQDRYVKHRARAIERARSRPLKPK
jgi:hypothetical protein